MFWYSWDLLQYIKSSTDLELCFSVYFCALADACYQRQAPGCAGRRSSIPGALAFTDISRGEASALSWHDQSFKGEAVRFPMHCKGWDFLLFQWLPAWKRYIFKGAKHGSVFRTLMYKGWMKVICESREAAGHFHLALGIPGCDGGRSANSACALQQCGFSWALLMWRELQRVWRALLKNIIYVSHSRELWEYRMQGGKGWSFSLPGRFVLLSFYAVSNWLD